MLSRPLSRGFTLIELLITMSVLALLLALGLPAMATYLQNSKIGTSTSMLYGAIQNARAEAIRHNGRAQFVLTDTPVSTANLGSALVPAVAGRNWVVRAPENGTMAAIDSKDGGEGAATPAVQLNTVAAGAAPLFDGTITFDALGATFPAGATYTIDISNPAAGACVVAAGTIHCRRITVSAGGQIAACDPAVISNTDSRKCPP